MEEKILNVLISMQSDICDMKSDIKEMKQDIKQLNERVDRLEVKVDRLEEADKQHNQHYIQLIKQRQIDSNNIAQFLYIQTQMLKNQDEMYA